MTTLDAASKTIERDRLVNDGESMLIALSGGADSVALLHLLSRLKRRMHLKLAAVYVNHNIRPRAALKEEEFCRQLCDRLRVPLIIVSEDVPSLARHERRGLEETARKVRYAIFERLADERGFDRVALGHHADDQVETILFRLFRGTGPSGLIGMPVKRGKFIRPLLDITRADILAYLKKHRLTWCEDASNRSLKFRRNWIRHRLLPVLRQNLNPRVDSAVWTLAETLQEEEAVLTEVVDGALSRTITRSPGGKIQLALKKYAHYAIGIRRRLLRHCLKVSCPDIVVPSKEVVQRLDSLALSGAGALSLPGSLRAEVAGDTMFIWRPGARRTLQLFEPGQVCNLDWPTVRVSGKVTPRPRRLAVRTEPGARKVTLDPDRLQPPLEVRSARPGERFRPLGMNGQKKVADYLADRKVPRPLREEVLLLCDRLGPVWLVGYEIAERAKVHDKTRRVLTVAVSIRKEASGAAV